MTTCNTPVMVFDLDDTLYPEREYVISGIKAVAGQVERLFEVDYAAKLLHLYERGEKDFLGTVCALLNLPDSVKESLLWTYRLHEPNIRLSADARETIDSLQSCAIPIAVLTDGRSVTQRLKLKALGLDKLPAYISEDYQSEKPSPQRFVQIANDFPASMYFYVADNPRKDFLAPNGLGWTTLWLSSGKRIDTSNPADFAPEYRPFAEIQNLAEALNFLPDERA